MAQSPYDAITNIMEQAKLSPVGVWKIDGKVRIIPTSQKKRFNSLMIDFSRQFLGVFDKDCLVQVLKENLA
jgi:hypothetical protein